jgi:hypothetical protein
MMCTRQAKAAKATKQKYHHLYNFHGGWLAVMEVTGTNGRFVHESKPWALRGKYLSAARDAGLELTDGYYLVLQKFISGKGSDDYLIHHIAPFAGDSIQATAISRKFLAHANREYERGVKFADSPHMLQLLASLGLIDQSDVPPIPPDEILHISEGL